MKKFFNKKSTIWFWLLIIILISGYVLGLGSTMETKIGHLLKTPLTKLSKNNQSIHDWWTNYRLRGNCLNELNQVKEQNNQLMVNLITLNSLAEENKQLRELLSFQKSIDFKMVTANVIYRGEVGSLLAPNQTFIINQGSNQGIVSDLVVINSQGLVIGKIGQVQSELAEVLLTTNKNCRLAVTVADHQSTIGLARGDLGLTIKLELVAQNEDLAIGQSVLTSGLEPAIPQGLVIGKINQITKESNALWQEVSVEPIVDIDQVNLVSVIVP